MRQSAPVGLVRTGVNSTGTGFLIGECLGITASHVFGRRIRIGRRLTFDLEAAGGSRFRGRIVAFGNVYRGSADLSGDWALFALADCPGSSSGYYPVANLAANSGIDKDFISIGYPRGNNLAPIVDPSCQIRARSTSGLHHDCAALPGNSGSPILRWNEEFHRYEAVAMITAGNHHWRGIDYRDDIANVAVDLASVVDHIKAFVERETINQDQTILH